MFGILLDNVRQDVVALRLNAVQRCTGLDLAVELMQMIPQDRF